MFDIRRKTECWDVRRRGRVDECTGLENRRALTRPGGSNPPVSANRAVTAVTFKMNASIALKGEGTKLKWPALTQEQL
jgi:hypothetical protein